MRCGVADLNGKDFIALVRLSDREDRTIAHVGQTCEKVPAGKHGGTASDALRKLLVSGLIAPAPAAPKTTPRAAKPAAEPEGKA